jgi:pimeloyl-ACP methyl ester carboxylesterase
MPTLRCNGMDVHYEQRGEGPTVLFVHGGVTDGATTWSTQRSMDERWSVVIIDRPGFGSSGAVERVDFATDAQVVVELLDRAEEIWGTERVNIVGHSYGGVVTLLAAAARPEAVQSLTVIEPPAFRTAVGHPAVDALVATLKEHWRTGPREHPQRFLARFLELVGSATALPDPLPPPLAQGAAMLVVERGPWEAEIPLARLAAAPFPKLVVSGGHNPAFDAVCDVLERDLGAARAVLTGAGHSVPRTGPPFNALLEQFMTEASMHHGEAVGG